MTTLFDLLNNIHNNNNNNNIYGGACKRTSSQCTSASSNSNDSNSSRKTISIIPELDVTMSNEQLLIQVELAGVNKQDIEIDINDSILTIKGKKKNKISNNNKPEIKEAAVEKDNNVKSNDHEPSIEEFEDDVKQQQTTTTAPAPSPSLSPSPTAKPTKYIQERTFGYFKRHLDLTKLLHQLNLNSINTTFENGLLSITIDKKENCLNSVKILIN